MTKKENGMRGKIKICGIGNLADARMAAELGADFLGFNFYRPSVRYIAPEAAAAIIAELPEEITTVGVVVNAGAAEMREILRACPLDMLQFHGDEDNEQCRMVSDMGVAVMKALRIKGPGDIGSAAEYDTEFILLDAFREELYGGTGQVFDWGWIRAVPGKKIFLAGGIGPGNIGQALAVGTYGVDLCSGVEKAPGVKDAAKMKLLFEKIAEYYG
jgi:phosphoribosylanthranilate isomerase